MIGLFVIAAGYGSWRTEHGKPVPKILERIRKRPMFQHPIFAGESAGIETTIVVTNPRDHEDVRREIELAVNDGDISCRPFIVEQRARHGSADAVRAAIPIAKSLGITHALIAYGDMPEWSSETVRELANASRTTDSMLTMLTVDWKNEPRLRRYGRIIYDESNTISRVVEYLDASAGVRAITTVNPSLWIWRLSWLEENIDRVQPVRKADGMGDEIHMPPLVHFARLDGERITEVRLPAARAREALGVNTKDEYLALHAEHVTS